MLSTAVEKVIPRQPRSSDCEHLLQHRREGKAHTIPGGDLPLHMCDRGRRLRRKVLVVLLWISVCCKAAADSVMRTTAETRSHLLYETFLYYNPFLLVAGMLWLWGINLRVFSAFKVNYAKVFDLDGTHLMWKGIWMIALWITLGVLTSMTLYLYLSSHGSSLAASQPVLLYSVIPLMMVLPFDALFVSSRIFFLRTLVRIIFPLQPITFADFFVADILTSMAKVLSDLERAACRMFHGQVATLSWFEPDSTCGSHSIWIPCVLALPYVFRFFQCLRQYSDTRDNTCIFNALKYASSFPVILLSALKYHVTLDLWHGLYRPLWLLSGLINTCFSFYWDIRRDWDLSFFSGLCNPKYSLLRPNLLYHYHSIYYGAIGSNLLLRWAWTYKLSAHLRHNYITVFLMTALEMLRRFQWIFFRVESEWNKISRLSSQTSSKETLKETEMLISPTEYDM
ncbi:hypothetical protein KP509_12G000100 [Ceratopteris richardii]|uniref:EXS domain-containing protein n=1 Tax=Ceratopteris richardii TaxID=49495 RepID=A0A8T2TLJ5_CERRI|nr:hypothetical protein KP509_12G000100 [Ceratopteris richardii]